MLWITAITSANNHKALCVSNFFEMFNPTVRKCFLKNCTVSTLYELDLQS